MLGHKNSATDNPKYLYPPSFNTHPIPLISQLSLSFSLPAREPFSFLFFSPPISPWRQNTIPISLFFLLSPGDNAFSFFPRWHRSPPLFLFLFFPLPIHCPLHLLYYSLIRFLLALALSCSHQILDRLSTERSSRAFPPNLPFGLNRHQATRSSSVPLALALAFTLGLCHGCH
jgi:hypothetical protein